ncbi:MAG: LEA type 2 family protein [Rubrivivax sp.]|nr:LEA type 2 family protein [Rubrivivax sp.]
MTTAQPNTSRRHFAAALATGLALSACAGLPASEPPRVNIVGLEKLSGEGFELRFNVKLRVQNPGDRDLEFDGLSLDLDVNGRPLATGVSAAKGILPRFGETVISVPVSVNAVSAVRQMLGLSDGSLRGELPYAVRGRLGGGVMGSTRFSAEGTLKLPQ